MNKPICTTGLGLLRSDITVLHDVWHNRHWWPKDEVGAQAVFCVLPRRISRWTWLSRGVNCCSVLNRWCLCRWISSWIFICSWWSRGQDVLVVVRGSSNVKLLNTLRAYLKLSTGQNQVPFTERCPLCAIFVLRGVGCLGDGSVTVSHEELVKSLIPQKSSLKSNVATSGSE